MSTEIRTWQKFGASVDYLPDFPDSIANQMRYQKLLGLVVGKTESLEIPYPYLELQLHQSGIPIPEMTPQSIEEYRELCNSRYVAPFKQIEINAFCAPLNPHKTLWQTTYQDSIYGDTYGQNFLNWDEYASIKTYQKIAFDQIPPKPAYEMMIRLHRLGISSLDKLLFLAKESNFSITRGFVNFDRGSDIKLKRPDSGANREHQISIYFGRNYIPHFCNKRVCQSDFDLQSGITFVRPTFETAPLVKLNHWLDRLSQQLGKV